ncbi:2-dehydro-3-deoxygalactonokinase [Piscinibacter sp. XHJ-5]|uniref:2-dehydro-3-deoxygalactonokinase n=1 Tax=Piscinibacter sp. XHJ-5 TaxID=3037797 RepID=UPI0024529608|nr:2-dehydro-3-deoxygalactonokinase [Piscinibacter sp. XHJ-5]
MIVRASQDAAAGSAPAAIVGIDWGTTRRRVVALDAQAAPLREFDDDAGMLSAAGRFAAVLDATLERIGPLAPGARVLLSGMVGSAQGWHPVPYVDSGTPLESLARCLFAVPDAPRGLDCRIVPGCRWRGDAGEVDVMRGEETQLLGAVALGRRDGGFVLPGTHSKWVALRDGRIEHFSTYLSGELFALLSQHGTLAPLVREPRDDEAAFAAGVQASARAALSHVLFECRARVVAGDMPTASAREYLSGVLIGAEWHDALRRLGRPSAPVCVIGTPELAALHVRAGRQLGVPVELLDAREAQLAAWAALARGLWMSEPPRSE